MGRIRLIYCLVLSTLLFTACSREEVVLTEEDVNARIDSIVHLQAQFAKERAAEDLDRRQAIEVKVKTDSIISARSNGAASSVPPPPANREP